MAVASWKGSIQFGPMIAFGVQAKAADAETKFAFNTHHAADGGRLRQQRPVCEACGDVIEAEQQCRGYKGAYPVDETYLDSLELEKSAVMALDGLVPAEQIEPRMYRRSYDLSPEKGVEKTYVLFRDVLVRRNRVAVGKVVMGGKEAIVAVRPRDGLLAMELLWWPEELRQNTDARAAIANVEIADVEAKMADQLAQMMETEFDPSVYKNEYAAAVGGYLDQLLAGQAPTPIEHRAAVAPTQNIEDALAASLAMLQSQVEATVAAKTGKKGKKVA